jgi:hypothetical protein
MAIVTPRLVAAMREQLAARDRALGAGATHVGWKLGMGDRESIASHIVVGHLTSASVLEPGAAYRAHPAEDLHVDVEAYVELDGDGPDAVGGYGLALEIVDLTPLEGEPDSIVAANIYHRAVSFGDPMAHPSEGADVGLRVNDELRHTNPWPHDIPDRLAGAAEVLDAVGLCLRAADRIITGSIVQLPVTTGDSIAAVMSGAVALSLEIA